MKFFKDTFKSLTKKDIALWICSIIAITVSFFAMKNDNWLTLCASLIGATSLIFLAKGNVLGQFLMVAFAVLYGVISFTYKYYGEMITYVGMTLPIAVLSIVTWLKNPYNGKTEVKINTIALKEYCFAAALTCAVTVAFYFILRYFNTANLILSTVSVFTSFSASYFELRRSELYAVCFVFNDGVLIALWVLATIEQINYLSMVVCFSIFLINDLYGFACWTAAKKKQRLSPPPEL